MTIREPKLSHHLRKKIIFQLCLLLLIGFSLFFFNGCQQNTSDSKNLHKKFVKKIESFLKQGSKKLSEPLVKSEKKKVTAILANLYQKVGKAKKPWAVGVVDKKGTLVSVWHYRKNNPEGVGWDDEKQNYGNYKVIQKALCKDCITTGQLFTPDNKWYVVCKAITHKRRIIGALSFFFSSDYLAEYANMTGEDFLSLEFN